MTAYTTFGSIPLFKYGVILADPPWLFETYDGAPSVPYDVMKMAEIAAMPVGHLAAPHCALLLWGTSAHLPQILACMGSWGFAYKSSAFSWAKTNRLQFDAPASASKTWFMGRGYASRSNTEDCWLGTVGSPQRKSAGVRELIVAPRREHSRKPEEIYQRAEALYPGPYLDLFSRQERDGWDCFGNETEKFAISA